MKIDIPLQIRYGGVALLFLGPILIFLSGGLILAARSTQFWPVTDASVIRSEIQVSQKASGIRRTQTRFNDYYTPIIEYSYVVDGEQYKGTQIRLHSDSGSFDRAEVEQWMGKYQVGATIPIHYSPRKPHRSVIDTTADMGLLFVVLMFGILAVPGGLVMRRFGLPQQLAESIPFSETATGKQSLDQRSAGRGTLNRLHLAIRAFALLVGLALALFGGFGVVFCIRKYIGASNSVEPGADVSLAAAAITACIFIVFALSGVFLIWKGIKRSKPPASKSSPTE